MRGVVTIALLALACGPLHAAVSELVNLDPTGSELNIGEYTIDLGEFDGEGYGRIFLGPIRVARGVGPTCTVSDHVALVVLPIGVVNGNLLYISTFSGSLGHLHVVDAETCAVRWTSPAYSRRPVFLRNAIKLNELGTYRIGHNGLPVR